MSEDAFIDKNAVQIARHLQRLRGIDEDDKSSEESPYGNRVEKRKTIYNLEKRMKKPRTIGTLDVAFRKRFLNISNNINEGNKSDMNKTIRECRRQLISISFPKIHLF